MKIANIVILGLLLGITGLLGWQNWNLKQELASNNAAAVQPLPAPAILPEPQPPPAPVAAAKKPPTKSAANRNYTQPAKDLAPPVTAPIPARTEPPPAPIERTVPRVVPTDVMQAPPRVERINATIPPGTVVTVRLLDTLSTDRNQAGDQFRASLQDPIIHDGNVVVPRGATVEGRVIDAQQAGRVKGVAEMTLELSQLRLPNGETVVLDTSSVLRQGETSTGQDTAKVGAGAAIGAAIGAISGGGKGAAIGAATGAGAGTAGVLLTRGKPLVLSQETVLSFSLNAPVTMEVTPEVAGEAAQGHPDDYSYAPPERRPSNEDWDGGSGRPVLRRRQ